jgi:hypothetical protein
MGRGVFHAYAWLTTQMWNSHVIAALMNLFSLMMNAVDVVHVFVFVQH